LTVLSPRAGQQIRELQRHYRDLGRPEAIRGLAAALEAAWRTITTSPASGLPAPRPGWAWVKSGRYWIGYQTDPAPVIAAVFYETANIPGRL
jgi:plasmid stabilization system protein ParE